MRLIRSNEAANLAHLPPGLRHEMTGARALGRVAATLVDDRPVSFCYPVWQTESWWDVSIHTLEPYRRRGLAVAAMRLMTAEMQKTGRAPIWSTLASNTPPCASPRSLASRRSTASSSPRGTAGGPC